MTKANGQTYEGGCHCGHVRFRVSSDLSRVIVCNCSICTKKGFLHLIVAPEQFELVCGADAVTDNVDLASLKPHSFDGRNWEHAIAERVPWR